MSDHKKITIEDILAVQKIMDENRPKKPLPLVFSQEQIDMLTERGEQFDFKGMRIRGYDFIVRNTWVDFA
jgi:hypothetical protein